ncbi:MAG: eCIS core domain-containing protein [Gemmatimonadales bacterium]
MNRLTPEECARLGDLAARVDCTRVRLHRHPARLRALVLWLSRGRAVALGNDVFLPDRCTHDLATLAHELTHCGQFQRWGAARYFIRGTAAQLQELLHRAGLGRSPYAYRLEDGKSFDEYGMEQQGQIVEDSFRGDAEALAVSPYRPGDTASGLPGAQDAPSA